MPGWIRAALFPLTLGCLGCLPGDDPAAPAALTLRPREALPGASAGKNPLAHHHRPTPARKTAVTPPPARKTPARKTPERPLAKNPLGAIPPRESEDPSQALERLKALGHRSPPGARRGLRRLPPRKDERED